ncbi:hypothetical protein ACQ86N_23215 [Puia sp. P3]
MNLQQFRKDHTLLIDPEAIKAFTNNMSIQTISMAVTHSNFTPMAAAIG